jgi:uncharacterized membrane protein YgcG
MAKRTVFQRLNTIFGPEGVRQNQITSNKYSMSNDILLKTQSKEEYDSVKLQNQQNKYLRNVWKKVDGELFQQSIHYETTRIGSYTDFESMEFYPEISATLDVIMEEATTTNNFGKILNVYSDSNRIKGVLEDLFFNRLDIHVSLPMWVRNLAKYGDNFILLNLDNSKGVLGARQLPNFEIERREGDILDAMISARNRINVENVSDESSKVKFFWRGRDVEFNSWQIGHFRLLGDDRRLPYGVSVLEKARRVWKQLNLAEDAMLVYRLTRAPERRIYKIFVGNIDEEDVPSYVDEIANRFKRTPIIDPKTGQIDVRYNTLANDQDFFIPVRDENAPSPIDTLPGACIALDTRIPLLDGRTLELQEIIEEWDSGNRDLWVYSCNPETGELAPGMITWAGETRKNTEVIKITLDNGESLITTPDHKWVHRTKGFVEAKDLIVGDSLMPFYRDKEYILNKKYSKKYERVWDSSKQEWVYTHRMVSWFMKENNNEQYHIFEGSHEKNNMKTIHHMDNNRFNNNPKNLFFMDSKDHYRYHRHELWSTPEKHNITIEKISKGLNRYISNLTEEEKQLRGNQSKLNSINSRDKANETFKNNLNRDEVIKNRGEKISIAKSTEEFKEKFSEIAKTNWQSEEYRNKVFSKKQNLIFTDELYNMFFEMFKLTGRADLALIELNKSQDFMNEFINSNKDIRSSLTNLNEFTHNHLKKMLKEKGFNNYKEWAKTKALELGYKNLRAWRYFMEKDKNSTEFYNHKITSIEWLENKIDTGTITVDGNEIYHNYHTFATESGVFIKNSNLDQIADIQYLQRKLFTALRVPKQFLNFDEAQGEGKNLSLQDVRFSRTINRIQQAVLAELNKIAIIHLVLLGFEDDLDNFTLTMNNPSTQAEMMKIEQMQMKVTLFKDAVSDSGNGFAPMSMTRAHREILGWSDDEIKQDLLEQRIEKAAASEMENTSNVIKYTGMFDKVDSIYGDIEAAKAGGTPSEGGDEEGGGGPTGGGGGSFGGGGLEFGGDEGGDEVPEEGAGETPEPEAGGEAPEAGGETPEAVPPLAESVNKKKVITERVLSGKVKKPINKKVYSNSFDNLMDSIKNKDEDKVLNERVKIYDKSLKINEDINNIINNIDKMLDE